MIEAIIKQAKQARQAIASKTAGDRRAALLQLAKTLQQQKAQVLAANQKDIAQTKAAGRDDAFLDRMTLTDDRYEGMIASVRQVAELPDILGERFDIAKQPSGITTSKLRIPIGTLLMIYESRPNVTIEAASLAIKSGNVIVLKGGSETVLTNVALDSAIAKALQAASYPEHAVTVLTKDARDITEQLLNRDDAIDLVIPRGSKRLLIYIKNTSKIPTLLHLEGNCHIYIDEHADQDMAINVAVNAKTQRFGVCNTLESLLIHESVAEQVLPEIAKQMAAKDVELRGDAEARALVKDIKPATEADWSTEYLAPILSIKIISSVQEAIDHINKYGSGHTDAIITNDQKTTDQFVNQVDSSSVLVNTSTRFADGFEYGLGAEIGISTGKLHARGPIGIEGLTTYKWVVTSDGAVRE